MNAIRTQTCALLRVNSSVLVCSVRYARKPRWVPMAKSKMYKIKEMPYRPVLEGEEIQRLQNNYRIYSGSLVAFQEKISEEESARSLTATNEGSEEHEWGRILAETERDNAIVKEIREKQLVEEWRQIEADILKEKTLLEDKALQDMKITEEKLHHQLNKLKDIITEDKLDEAIAKALSVQTDYNFAIDKDDRVYLGRKNSDKPQDIANVTTDLSTSRIQYPPPV